jgi:tetratricopeptide (TPR) repeat protein
MELAMRHHTAGRLAEAKAIYIQVLSRSPDYAAALHLLGLVGLQQGQPEHALELMSKSIQIDGKQADAHNNLGNVLYRLGRHEDAIASFGRALQLQPNYPEAQSNLGNVLRACGRLDEALAAYEQALKLRPDYVDGHWNLAQLLLLRGDYERGWREYEWRWKVRSMFMPRNFAQPRWRGEELSGKKILIHTEQGLGDAIQFVRYAPLIAQRGGRVIFECQFEVQRLLRQCPGVEQVVVAGQPLPAFDVQCPLLSLPGVFGTTERSVPADVPYVFADAAVAARWQQKLAGAGTGRKVGLVWGSGRIFPHYYLKSMALAELGPLARVAGVQFVSLQKGPAAVEASGLPAGMRLLDWTNQLSDFADTSALVAGLDLVISVDTAVAHLAGAMKKPVWTLIPFDPDWRWGLGQQDSPWYPTMRLFRQKRAGDWAEVVEHVAESLADWAG